MRPVAKPPLPVVFAFEGFVTCPKWSAVGSAVERQMTEEPNRTVVLECGRVTGFVPGAFLALTNLVRSAAGRVQLRNWPAAVSQTIVPQLIAAQFLDGLVSTITASAQQVGTAAGHSALNDSMTQLTARLAELQQNWFGSHPAVRSDPVTL